MPSNWRQKILEIIERLLELLGPPVNPPTTVEAGIALLNAAFQANPTLTGLSPADLEALDTGLTEFGESLSSPDNDLSGSDSALAQSLHEDMAEAIQNIL